MAEDEKNLRGEDKAPDVSARAATLELLLEEEFDKLYDRLRREEERANAIRWGGLFRRAVASIVDGAVLFLLFVLLSYLGYVGFRVGLAAHPQPPSVNHLRVFLGFLSFAAIFLCVGYSVLLHGRHGQTVGKWFLGLRVVDGDQRPITYGRALFRWVGTVVSALSGLGFVWIVCNKEKRGWHDLLAGTWVIREGKRQQE